MEEIKKVTPQEADNIIETRKPLGLFYTISNGIYVGIDNSYGDAWTEDFKSLSSCKKWLMGDYLDKKRIEGKVVG